MIRAVMTCEIMQEGHRSPNKLVVTIFLERWTPVRWCSRVCRTPPPPFSPRTSGTPLVLEWAKDMVVGQGARVGEVALICYVLLLSAPQETG